VFSGGRDRDGNPRIQVTRCPVSILTEPGNDALDAVEEFLAVTPFDANGMPGPPTAWPDGKPYVKQLAKRADAFRLLRNEWPHLHYPKRPEPKAAEPAKEPMIRRRS
jgi:hypothetical protein